MKNAGSHSTIQISALLQQNSIIQIGKLANIATRHQPRHNPFPANHIHQPSKFAALEIRQQPFQNSGHCSIVRKQYHPDSSKLVNIATRHQPLHNPFPANHIHQPSKFAALEIRQQPFQNSARQFIATKQQQTCQYCNPPSTATQSISSQSHSPTQQVCRP
nr:hypothetical protein [uncultured Ottowia sp.]